MAGIKGDFEKLKKLAGKLEDIAKPKFRIKLGKNVAEEAIELVHQGFEDGMSPYGKRWPSPRLRTANGTVSPLRDTGRLQRSFHLVQSGMYKFVIETNVKYAATHQYGAVIKAKNFRTGEMKINQRAKFERALDKAGFSGAAKRAAMKAQQATDGFIKTVKVRRIGLVFRGVDSFVTRNLKTGRKNVSRTYSDWIFAMKVTIPQRQMMPEAKQGLPKNWKAAFNEVATDVLTAFFGKK